MATDAQTDVARVSAYVENLDEKLILTDTAQHCYIINSDMCKLCMMLCLTHV
jgi:hypothetical protein